MSWVQAFSEGSREQRDLLGGKGAGVAEMTRVLGPDRVPAGFTITTEACVAYMQGGRTPPEGLEEEVDEALAALERQAGKRARQPRLAAPRLGALGGARVDAGNARHGAQPRPQRRVGRRARRGHRRRAVCLGLLPALRADVRQRRPRTSRPPRSRTRSSGPRTTRGSTPTPTSARDRLRELTSRFRKLFTEATGEAFPDEPREQLRQAIIAVFDSWDGERAVAYRRINGIPDDWGTAVNVQRMVFGNRGADSGSGVAFSRDQRTGEPTPSGDFLPNAQGEDVVAGIRDPEGLDGLGERLPEAHAELLRDLSAARGPLQGHAGRGVHDRGRAGCICCRRARAKRPAQAAVRFAVDAVSEGLLTKEEALLTIEAEALDALLHPVFDPAVEFEVLTTGVAASPGAAAGAIVLSAADAVRGPPTART